jgi:hypothetical protein
MAHRTAPEEAEIAASYAHALVRTGRWQDARRVLSTALAPSEDLDAVLRQWLKASPPPHSQSSTSVVAVPPGERLSHPAQG